MKAKVDENLPEEIAEVLRRFGIDAETVLSERLHGQPDSVIWKAACTEGRVLITQDIGIADIRLLDATEHPGLLLLRLASDARQNLIDSATAVAIARRDDDWRNCVVVVTERKVRLRRSGPTQERKSDA